MFLPQIILRGPVIEGDWSFSRAGIRVSSWSSSFALVRLCVCSVGEAAVVDVEF